MATSEVDALVAAAAPFLDEIRALRPAGVEVLDVHTHLGLDDDGATLSLEKLLADLDVAGVARACVFPLHDPDRRPAYRTPNDRVLAWAAASGGRLVPFCRVDPADGAVAEAERALGAGARGIKLHPQSDAFSCAEPAVRELFALAERARVPILVHAGSFVPGRVAIAGALVEVARAHPGVTLILAHAAIADMALFTTRLADHPRVLYDTAWLAATDLLELAARVPAERLVFGSDPPYGHPLPGLYLALRLARRLGLDGATTGGLLGDTMRRVLAGVELPAACPPRHGPTLTLVGRLARVYLYCSMAYGALFGRSPEAAARVLELAIGACRDPTAGPHAATLERIHAALSAAAPLLQARTRAGGLHAMNLVQMCMTLAATEPAA